MARILVRDLEDDVRDRLQQRARRHGRSMEAEVRDILRDAVKSEGSPAPGLGTAIASRFKGIGLRGDETIPEITGMTIESPFEK